MTNAPIMACDTRPSMSSPQLEQDLSAAIRFQRLLERFLELLERVHLLHCGRELSISYEFAQLPVNLLDLCSGALRIQLMSQNPWRLRPR